MLNALVSVVIPTYKRKPKIVKRAVQSVVSQSYSKLEIIIIDDSPSDFPDRENIKNMLAAFNDNRIKYIMHYKNCGANVARNTGIKVSKGEFLAFLDDDDEWLPSKLQLQIKKFKNTNVGLVYGPYFVYQKNEKRLRKNNKKGFVFRDLLYENFIGSTSCVMVRKNSLEDVGLFDEKLPASQDYDLYLRISYKYPVDVVDNPIMKYYEHGGERISGNRKKKAFARKYIYEKYNGSIKKYPWIDSEKNLLLAYGYSQSKDTRLKWKHWISAFVAQPTFSKRFIKYSVKIWLNL